MKKGNVQLKLHKEAKNPLGASIVCPPRSLKTILQTHLAFSSSKHRL